MAKEKQGSEKSINQRKADHRRQKVQLGKSWFFGIGANHYQEFPDLNNAVKDVEDIRDLLIDKYDLEPDCTFVLTNEEATREGIIDQLDQLIHTIEERDKLIIYYSGHGHLDDKTKRGYWIPHDAKKTNKANYLSNSTIRDYIKDIKSLHTLLISDACFSGTLFVRGAKRSIGMQDELETIPSRWAICSGRHNEEVFDGTPGENSPFAESILDILSRNQEKALNVAKFADQVVEQTRANYIQLPEGNPLFGVGHKGGQYIFRLKLNEHEAWIACEEENTLESYRLFLEKYPNGQFSQKAKEKIEFLEEEEAWEKAIALNTLFSYLRYLKNYPAGRYCEQALNKIAELEAEQAWQEAIKQNTIDSYSKYISKYPQGKYVAEAESAIKLIKEGKKPNYWEAEQAWQEAVKQDTIDSYKKYISEYPQGKYRAEAESAIKSIERGKKDIKWQEQEAWHMAVKENTVHSYIRYISKYPQGKYRAEAESAIKSIERGKKDIKWQEQEAWHMAVKENTVHSYIRYISKYPQGKYRAEAESAIKSIKKGKKPSYWEEEQAWQEAIKQHTIDSYNKYISEYPQGKFRAEAESAIKSIERGKKDIIWHMATSWVKASLKKPARWAIMLLLTILGAMSIYFIVKNTSLEPTPSFTTFEKLNRVVDSLDVDVKGLQFKQGDNQVVVLGEVSSPQDTGEIMSALRGASEISKIDNQLTISQAPIGAISSPSPSISVQFNDDELIITITKGAAPYELKLTKDGQEKYGQKLTEAGSYKINLTKYRGNPGKYDIEVKGQGGKSTSKHIDIAPPETGTVADTEGRSYPTIRLNGKEWLAENLNLHVGEGSWCYQNNPVRCDGSGRLYTWEAAKAACADLGVGWRLPHDSEWSDLISIYTAAEDDISDDNKAAYEALKDGGWSGLNLKAGGMRTVAGGFNEFAVWGSYWSNSAADSNNRPEKAWRIKLGEEQVERDFRNALMGFSCRCIKD